MALCVCSWEEDYKDHEFILVNFYHSIFIQDPDGEVVKHLSFLQEKNVMVSKAYGAVTGTIFVLSGTNKTFLQKPKQRGYVFHELIMAFFN